MLARFRRLLFPASVVLIILVTATLAFARAGGGEGYPSGRGGGGSGGGGGDFGDLLFLLLRLIIYYPAVGIPVTIVVIIVAIYLQRSGVHAYQGNVIRRGHRALSDRQHSAMIANLRRTDPSFEEPAFTARVTTAFHKIQSAWSNQDLQPVRPFISDAVHERFSLQFEEQRAAGYRNVTDDVVVADVRIAHVRSDRFFDTVAVRIAASASDRRVRLSDGAPIGGSDRSGPFVEIWSLLRRRGTRTDPSRRGLIEGNCPNCGAGIAMNQNANCAHCGALLRSGEHDWVLAEITQEYEWSADAALAALPGVAEMIVRDPGFNLQDLEDRASVMFWRRAAADRTGSVEPLRKIAAEEFVQAIDTALRGAAGGARKYWGECAVGSVQTLGVAAGPEWDRAMVEVRWSGRRFIAAAERGKPPTPTEQTTLSRTVFELSRRAEARSDVAQAISSAHCPSCGAPEAGGTSAACAFCGVTLNDGRHGWVLSAVRSVPEARASLASAMPAQHDALDAGGEEDGDGNGAMAGTAAAAASGTAGTPTAVGVLAWMASVAAVDGQVDPRERQLLSRVAERRSIPPARLDALLLAAARREVDLPMPHDMPEARQWLSAMASAALADGNLSRDELDLLRHTGARLGLGNHDVKMLLKRSRTESYERARGALRAVRRGQNGDPGQGPI